MARPTHEDGIAAAQAVADQFGLAWADMRQIAAQNMEDTMPDLEEIGSSDVSCHLSSMANYDLAGLQVRAAKRAERKALLADLVARSGRSEAEVLEGLRGLLAPR